MRIYSYNRIKILGFINSLINILLGFKILLYIKIRKRAKADANQFYCVKTNFRLCFCVNKLNYRVYRLRRVPAGYHYSF